MTKSTNSPPQRPQNTVRLLGLTVIDAGGWKRLRRLFAALLVLSVGVWWVCFRMPGQSWRGVAAALSAEEADARTQLQADVEHLAETLPDRHVFSPQVLTSARDWVRQRLGTTGLEVSEQTYQVQGDDCSNLWVEVPGTNRPAQVFVVGAHYDAQGDTPGADDNASGVAGMLWLAQWFSAHPQPISLRFAAFVNEEPPHFWSDDMGSLVYARELARQGTQVVGMWSLECLGYYDPAPGAQRYPGPQLGNPLKLLYPSTGDYIAFIGNASSSRLTRNSLAAFRATTAFPSEGLIGSSAVPGLGWSDHWSFWRAGYQAVMVTDTATFRNPNYHQPSDLPKTLDFNAMARVVVGLRETLKAVAR